MATKAKSIYEIAKKLMFAKPSARDFDSYYTAHLLKVLNETFEENNALRVFKGKQPLETRVKYSELVKEGYEIDYEDEYCEDVLPMGLAYRLSVDDGDGQITNAYNVDYMNARSRLIVANSDDTTSTIW